MKYDELEKLVMQEAERSKKLAPKLEESRNTLAADVNEILMGYYVAGSSWARFRSQKDEVLTALKQRSSEISEQEYADQDGRALKQAEVALEWAAQNGYDGQVTQVWWTARPGVLSAATETDVDSRKNPTDILLKFSDGGFLGLSAKSTKGKGDIGFKNPGIGRLGRDLGIPLVDLTRDKYQEVLSNLEWEGATTTSQRKSYLKNLAGGKKMSSQIALAPYYAGGVEVLKALRDKLMAHYLSMDIEDLKEHFLDEWIDAKGLFPYYIKVTGRGTGGKYSASVVDPVKNEKVKKISSEHIQLEDIGSGSIGVWAGEGDDVTKLFKIRFKWESAPLASSIKMSGEPF